MSKSGRPRKRADHATAAAQKTRPKQKGNALRRLNWLVTKTTKTGEFYFSIYSDCLSKQSRCRTVVIGDDYPSLLRGRRRKLRWSEEDRRLCRRHFWRSEGFHEETKTEHGLRRAVWRGFGNMKIQPCPTAAAINLKRLATAFDA